MNPDKVNSWLTLVANIGVLIGIFIVIVEMRQTQTAMLAESSTIRTQIGIENAKFTEEIDYTGLIEKLRNSEPLSEEEEVQLRQRMAVQLRYFENLHYQWQLGLLDEEIWISNLAGISRLHDNPAFNYIYSDWPNGFSAEIHRSSFVNLIESYRD